MVICPLSWSRPILFCFVARDRSNRRRHCLCARFLLWDSWLTSIQVFKAKSLYHYWYNMKGTNPRQSRAHSSKYSPPHKNVILGLLQFANKCKISRTKILDLLIWCTCSSSSSILISSTKVPISKHLTQSKVCNSKGVLLPDLVWIYKLIAISIKS